MECWHDYHAELLALAPLLPILQLGVSNPPTMTLACSFGCMLIVLLFLDQGDHG